MRSTYERSVLKLVCPPATSIFSCATALSYLFRDFHKFQKWSTLEQSVLQQPHPQQCWQLLWGFLLLLHASKRHISSSYIINMARNHSWMYFFPLFLINTFACIRSGTTDFSPQSLHTCRKINNKWKTLLKIKIVSVVDGYLNILCWNSRFRKKEQSGKHCSCVINTLQSGNESLE